MISEFEKLFKAQRSYRSSDKEAFIRGCEAAYQHQQSKVDELKKRLDAVILEIEKLHLSGVIGFGTVKELEQALKGGGE